MDIDSMIAVLQAAKEGKTIQFHIKRSVYDSWCDLSGEPVWDFNTYDYRVKPEPMEIEAWFAGPCLLYSKLSPSSPEYDREREKNGWTKKKFREVIE